MSEANDPDLPESWCWASLDEIGEWAGGGTPSKFNPAYWKDGSIPWVSPKDMKCFEIFDAEDHITEEAVTESATSKLAPDTVLMVTRSGILRHSFPVAVARVPVALNQDLKAITPHAGISAGFVARALCAFGQRVIHSCVKDGTTVQSIETSLLRSFQIPLAPANEQTRVIEVADELLSDLDAGVAALERVRAKLKHYRAAVLKAAVEGALTAEWRAQHPATEPASALLTRILAERRRRWEEAQLQKFKEAGRTPPKDWRAKYQEPVAPEETELPPLPEGWTVASMDAITCRITSGSRDWQQYYGRGSGTFVMAQNVRPGHLDMSYRQSVDPPAFDSSCERSLVECDDLLVTIVGANTGDVCRVPEQLVEHYVCQSVALMRPVLHETGRFLDTYFNSPGGGQFHFRRYLYGAGRPHLSFDQLKMTPVLLPPLAEQEAIVEAVEDQLSVIEHLEADIKAKLKSAQALRQSILRHAFTGQLVPQDPNDEPAAELLKRIAAQREERARQAGAGNPKKRAGRAVKAPSKNSA